MEEYIHKYDASVFSAAGFSHVLPIPQFLISPSIDPLSDKNKELDQKTINRVLKKYGIPKDKPIIMQVSRYDYLKDPVGVIEAYRLVKKYIDCRLVFVGNRASDDPEGDKVLSEVRKKAGKDKDIHMLLMDPVPEQDVEVNALQRSADVIVQKSIREGFALVVTEALWKAKPTVASNVGGIPLQIKHKWSGLLCYSIEGAAFEIKQLLNSPAYAKILGQHAKEHVRNNFLLTRHLKEYMLLFLSLFHEEDVVYL